jgi:uncharacterized protein (DUF1778 family)
MARSEMIRVLVEPEEKAMLERVAADSGLSVSAFVRMAAISVAREKGYLK